MLRKTSIRSPRSRTSRNFWIRVRDQRSEFRDQSLAFCRGATHRRHNAIESTKITRVARHDQSHGASSLSAVYNGTMRAKPIQSYRELFIWQRSMQLCAAIYQVTLSFPRDEVYGLINQLRRAGVSVPSNIAEGYGRLTREQYRHFLGVAQGSNLEIQPQLEIARRLQFGEIPQIEKVEALSFEVGRMLTALLKRLRPSP